MQFTPQDVSRLTVRQKDRALAMLREWESKYPSSPEVIGATMVNVHAKRTKTEIFFAKKRKARMAEEQRIFAALLTEESDNV
jgi:hypothetical protein